MVFHLLLWFFTLRSEMQVSADQGEVTLDGCNTQCAEGSVCMSKYRLCSGDASNCTCVPLCNHRGLERGNSEACWCSRRSDVSYGTKCMTGKLCNPREDWVRQFFCDFCPRTTFQCTDNFQCIPNTLVCNGDNDCSDGSDEDACSNSCAKLHDYDVKYKKFIECGNSTQCLRESWQICDGVPDCKNGFDESQCERIAEDKKCQPASHADYPCKAGTWCFVTGTAELCSPSSLHCTCQTTDYGYSLRDNCNDDWKEFNCFPDNKTLLGRVLNVSLSRHKQEGGLDISPNICRHDGKMVCQRALPAGKECEKDSQCRSSSCHARADRSKRCCDDEFCTNELGFKDPCRFSYECNSTRGLQCIHSICVLLCAQQENALNQSSDCADKKFERQHECAQITCTKEDCCPDAEASTSAMPATVGTPGMPTTPTPGNTPESTDIPNTVVTSTPIPSASGNGFIFSTWMYTALGVAILVFLLTYLFYFWFTCQRSQVTYPRAASISSLSTVSLTHV